MPLQPKLLVIVAPCLRFPFYAFSAHVCQRQAGQSADCRLGLWVSFQSPSPTSSLCPAPATALNCLLCRPKLHCSALCPTLLCCAGLCLVLWHAINLCIAFGFGGYWGYALHLPSRQRGSSLEACRELWLCCLGGKKERRDCDWEWNHK